MGNVGIYYLVTHKDIMCQIFSGVSIYIKMDGALHINLLAFPEELHSNRYAVHLQDVYA